MLEAEVKFALDEPRAASLRAALIRLGATLHGSKAQADLYFAHPTRDFAQTDEALRLRRSGDRVWLTWKGPKLDPTLKIREEIELDFGQDFDAARTLLERLSFMQVREVRKLRETWSLPAPASAEIVIDEVTDLGLFCEVEVLASTAAEGRSRLEVLLVTLDLGDLAPVVKSYLELLLSAAGSSAAPNSRARTPLG